MTDADRIVRDQQVRVLLAGGERGPVLQRLFGVSPRTIKRLLRKTATSVRGGRTPGPARGWLGRERAVVEQVLQQWVHEGLGKLLAGEAPTWLHELARHAGVPGAASIAAMVQRVEVHEHEPMDTYGGEAVARLVVCATCHTPRIVVRREGVQRVTVPRCPTPTCRASGAASARISHLDDWRRRRAREEER